MIPLTEWAKQKGLTPYKAHKMFREGKIPGAVTTFMGARMCPEDDETLTTAKPLAKSAKSLMGHGEFVVEIPARLRELAVRVSDMLAMRFHDCEINAALKVSSPELTDSDLFLIYRAAKELLAGYSGKSRDEMRKESYLFYIAQTRDMSLPAIVRMKAQDQIDKLYGLMAATRSEVDFTGKLKVEQERKSTLDHDKFSSEFLKFFAEQQRVRFVESNSPGQPVHPALPDAQTSNLPDSPAP